MDDQDLDSRMIEQNKNSAFASGPRDNICKSCGKQKVVAWLGEPPIGITCECGTWKARAEKAEADQHPKLY